MCIILSSQPFGNVGIHRKDFILARKIYVQFHIAKTSKLPGKSGIIFSALSHL